MIFLLVRIFIGNGVSSCVQLFRVIRFLDIRISNSDGFFSCAQLFNVMGFLIIRIFEGDRISSFALFQACSYTSHTLMLACLLVIASVRFCLRWSSIMVNGAAFESNDAPQNVEGVTAAKLLFSMSHDISHPQMPQTAFDSRKVAQPEDSPVRGVSLTCVNSCRWTIFNDRKVALSEDPPFDLGYIYFYESVGPKNS